MKYKVIILHNPCLQDAYTVDNSNKYFYLIVHYFLYVSAAYQACLTGGLLMQRSYKCTPK